LDTQYLYFTKPVCGSCAGDHPTNSKLGESHLNNQLENRSAGFKGRKVRMKLSKKRKPGVKLSNKTNNRTN